MSQIIYYLVTNLSGCAMNNLLLSNRLIGMSRNKKTVVNNKSYREFTHYINARSKKLGADRVDELSVLISSAVFRWRELEHGISAKYENYQTDPEMLTELHKAELALVDTTVFEKVNNAVDSITGLKSAFRNAQNQKRYKNKNKHETDRKVSLEMTVSERHWLLSIREECKKQEVDLTDVLMKCNIALKKGS